MQKIYSLHKIENPTHFSFDPSCYSKFKFGDDIIAERFGIELANGFIRNFLSKNPINNQIVVLSSPYAFIPTATFALKNYFVYRINSWLVDNNYPVIQEARVHRTVTYKEDYGALDAEERINLISNDCFQIDKEFVGNKTLIFLDDIKITGSHERLISKMIKQYELTNEVFFLYFAELINKTVHPNIENYLNYYFVKSIFDLDMIINKSRFCINTRIVKYILNSNENSFIEFLKNQNLRFRELLYNMALGNSYHLIDAYSSNILYLKDSLISHQTKHFQYGN